KSLYNKYLYFTKPLIPTLKLYNYSIGKKPDVKLCKTLGSRSFSHVFHIFVVFLGTVGNKSYLLHELCGAPVVQVWGRQFFS
ncbi:MAG: hypothetical protein ACI4S4_07875, partial [Candidatus Ornithospirochaeta sp.]